MYYDYHVHSNFSPDSITPMSDTIEEGIRKGFKEICFTDHIDYDYEVPDLLFEFDVEKYIEHIASLKKKYEGKIKILMGVEIGIQPHVIQKCSKLIESNHFDFVISSIHMCSKKDLYNGDFYKDVSAKESMVIYLKEILYCAQNFDNFSVLGHINLISRYNEEVRNLDIMEFEDILTDIFKVLVEKGKGIELNTSSLRYVDTFLLTKEVLSLYHKSGGKIITTGSDSHNPTTLGYGFDLAYKLLKEVGFTHITTFENMEPRFIEI